MQQTAVNSSQKSKHQLEFSVFRFVCAFLHFAGAQFSILQNTYDKYCQERQLTNRDMRTKNVNTKMIGAERSEIKKKCPKLRMTQPPKAK